MDVFLGFSLVLRCFACMRLVLFGFSVLLGFGCCCLFLLVFACVCLVLLGSGEVWLVLSMAGSSQRPWALGGP